MIWFFFNFKTLNHNYILTNAITKEDSICTPILEKLNSNVSRNSYNTLFVGEIIQRDINEYENEFF
jgi:hypothetical protein